MRNVFIKFTWLQFLNKRETRNKISSYIYKKWLLVIFFKIFMLKKKRENDKYVLKLRTMNNSIVFYTHLTNPILLF